MFTIICSLVALIVGWNVPMPSVATKIWDSIRGTITTVVKKNAATVATSVVNDFTNTVTNPSAPGTGLPVIAKIERPLWADDNK